MIIKAEKGGAVIIIGVEDYIREAESQFKNKDNYDRLKNGTTERHNRLVKDTIQRFKNQKMMKEKVTEGLKTENRRTLKLYLRPKIHKKGNPGCPAQLIVTPPIYERT